MLANALIRAAATQLRGYRYWALFVANNVNPGMRLQLLEIELRATPGGPDLTNASTPVTCTHTSYPGYPISRVVDESLETAYFSDVTGPKDVRIVFDLGAPGWVGALAIYSQYADNTDPKDFSLQASANGVDFETLKSWTQATWTARAWHEFVV